MTNPLEARACLERLKASFAENFQASLDRLKDQYGPDAVPHRPHNMFHQYETYAILAAIADELTRMKADS